MRCGEGRGRHGARAWRVGEGASAATAGSPSSSAGVVANRPSSPSPGALLLLLSPSFVSTRIFRHHHHHHHHHHRYFIQSIISAPLLHRRHQISSSVLPPRPPSFSVGSSSPIRIVEVAAEWNGMGVTLEFDFFTLRPDVPGHRSFLGRAEGVRSRPPGWPRIHGTAF